MKNGRNGWNKRSQVTIIMVYYRLYKLLFAPVIHYMVGNQFFNSDEFNEDENKAGELFL